MPHCSGLHRIDSSAIIARPIDLQHVAFRHPLSRPVRFDYAQVLGVSPIYQTLRATRMERVCDARHATGNGLSKVVSSVRDRFSGGTTREERAAGLSNCRMTPVVREYRRPIAYDVDYIYKGSKFRTRLADDPGNRLRVRVSITPQPMANP